MRKQYIHVKDKLYRGGKKRKYIINILTSIAKEKGYGIDIRNNNIAEIEANR